MKKKLLAVLLTVIMIMSTGCQLAQEDQGEKAVVQDRLAGVFITTEHLDLFDMEAYLEDNWNGESEIAVEDTSAYQGRIYASRVGEGDYESYEFQGLEGMLLADFLIQPEGYNEDQAYWSSEADEGLNDIHTSLNSRDDGQDTGIEGTIYLSTRGPEKVYYMNPVYQTESGEVYLTAGTGCNYDPQVGGAMSQTMTESRTYAEDDVEMTDSTSVKVTVNTVEVPVKVILIQMDSNHLELARMEAVPGQMPDALTVEAECAYILVEQVLMDGTVRWSVCQPGDDRNAL